MELEDRWVNKKVDLVKLRGYLVQFFKERKFAILEEDKDGKYRIIATPNQSHSIAESINVYIDGQPDDFKVRFDAGSHSSELVRLGILTSVFGGGMITLKGLKSQEALEKLEKEFWHYVDRAVWSIADSTRDSSHAK